MIHLALLILSTVVVLLFSAAVICIVFIILVNIFINKDGKWRFSSRNGKV